MAKTNSQKQKEHREGLIAKKTRAHVASDCGIELLNCFGKDNLDEISVGIAYINHATTFVKLGYDRDACLSPTDY